MIRTASPSPRSARRRRKPGPTKGEQTHARLVAAAIEEFSRRGFHRTKVSDIVRRAKVSQPAFYLYFSSKVTLYRHLVKRVRTELLSIIEHSRIPPDLSRDTAVRSARDAVKRFLQYFLDNPKLAVIGYFEAEGSDLLRQEIVKFQAQNVLAEQNSRYFRADFDAAFFSECFNGSLDRLIRSYLFTGKMTVDQLAGEVADLFQRGVQWDAK